MLADDLKKTEAFYTALGFEIVRSDEKAVGVKLGNFYMDFHGKEEYLVGFRKDLATDEPRGTGVSIYIEVEDVTAFHSKLTASNLMPFSAPEKMPWNNIEFGIKDPDGYVLCFYQLPA